MGSETSKYKSQINLPLAAQYEYDFLRIVSSIPALADPGFLAYTVQRYERFWLPLAAHHGLTIAAPVDIEWVWQVHMLSPHKYRSDCMKVAGHVLGHQCTSAEVRKKLSTSTEKIWNAKYPTEPYYADFNALPRFDNSFVSQISYDVVGAAMRQQSFLYQASLPHFRNITFLTKADKRYRMMLLLKKEHPSTFIVPCYDNDLIWHTHQLHPLVYESETKKFLGKMLDHDDSTNDRTPGEQLDTGSDETARLFKSKKKPFSVPGSMFRGDPPPIVVKEPTDRFTKLTCKKYTVKLEEMRFDRLPEGFNCKVSVGIAKAGGPPKKVHSATMETAIGRGGVVFQKNEGKINLNTEEDTGMHLALAGKCKGESGKAPTKEYSVVLDHTILSQLCDRNSGMTVELTIPASDIATPPAVLAVVARCDDSASTPTNYHFISKCGTTLQELPHLNQAVKNPDFMAPRSVHMSSAPCQFSANTLQTVAGVDSFVWRVVHCKAPALSAVEFLDIYNNLLATGHTIGPSVLPHPKQLAHKPPGISLNPVTQRAMLIRNSEADFAILRGSWLGFRRGSRNVRGKLGKFMLDIFMLDKTADASAIKMSCTLSDGQSIMTLKLHLQGANHIVHLNLKDGVMTAKHNLPCLPEVLCLCCCISVMFVLCHPRPPPVLNNETRTMTPYEAPPSNRPGVLNIGAMPFLVGAGLYNFYLPRHYNTRTLGSSGMCILGLQSSHHAAGPADSHGWDDNFNSCGGGGDDWGGAGGGDACGCGGCGGGGGGCGSGGGGCGGGGGGCGGGGGGGGCGGGGGGCGGGGGG